MRTIISFLALISLFACASHTNISKTYDAQTSKTTAQKIKQPVDDSRISLGIHADLAGLKLYKPIDVKVTNGKVIYTGTVRSEKDSLLAVGIAWKQNGVHEVINELKVDENAPGVNKTHIAKDSWITTKIKTKLLATSDIQSGNYTVITTDGVVYLLGKTNSTNELNKVKAIINEVDGVKELISKVEIN